MDMNVTTTDLDDAVQSTAMLADVTISMWGAERSDAKVMDEIKSNAGAVGNVGRVVKNMLAGADGALKDTRSAFSAVRTLHYSLTLPWVADPHAERQRGPRLLPNMLWEKYTTSIARARSMAYAQRDQFVTAYPDLIVQARANLGSLADANYPDPEEVRAQFKISVDMEPIPTGTSFKGLPSHILEKLSKALQAKQERMLQGAASAMWESVRDRVQRITERMADPEARFKKSTVEGVRDLIELIPGWNIAGDTRALEIAEDIKRMLSGVDSDRIRDNASVRQDVGEQAKGVMEKLSQWGL